MRAKVSLSFALMGCVSLASACVVSEPRGTSSSGLVSVDRTITIPNDVTATLSGLPTQTSTPHWVALAQVGSVAGGRSGCTHCTDVGTITGGAASVTIGTAGLSAGNYVVRVFRSGTTDMLQQSAPIRLLASAPTPAPTLNVADRIDVGSDATVAFSNFATGHSNNWLGLWRIRPDSSTLVSGYYRWGWAGDGTHNASSGTSVVDLDSNSAHDTTGLPAGYYEVRALYDNASSPIRASTRFVVSDATLVVSGALLTGTPVDLTYSGFPGSGASGDWVTIAPAGASESSYSCWSWTDGESGTVRLSSCSLTAGEYEARAYFNWTGLGSGNQMRYQVRALTRFSVRDPSTIQRIVRDPVDSSGITFIPQPMVCPENETEHSYCRAGVYLDRQEIWTDDEAVRVLCVYPTSGSASFAHASFHLEGGSATTLDAVSVGLSGAADGGSGGSDGGVDAGSAATSRIATFVVDVRGLAPGDYTFGCNLMDGTGATVGSVMTRTIHAYARQRAISDPTRLPPGGIPAEGIPIGPTYEPSNGAQPWGVTTGVPLPPGAVHDTAELVLIGTPSSGPPIPIVADLVVRARWSAGTSSSIQWLGLYFTATPGWTYVLRRRNDDDAIAPLTDMVTVSDGDYSVVGSLVSFHLHDGEGFEGIENLAMLASDAGVAGRSGTDADRPYIRLDVVEEADAGTATPIRAEFIPDTIEIVENGPAHATLRLLGAYHSGETSYHEGEILVHAFRDLPYVRIEHFTSFTTHPGDLVTRNGAGAVVDVISGPRVSDIGFPVPVAGTLASATFGLPSSPDGGTYSISDGGRHFVEQVSGHHYRLDDDSPAVGGLPGWVRGNTTVSLGIAVALADIVERFPRELEVGGSSAQVIVHAWPADGIDGYFSTTLTPETLPLLRFAHQGSELNLDPGSDYSATLLNNADSGVQFIPYQDAPGSAPASIQDGDGRGLTIATDFVIAPVPSSPVAGYPPDLARDWSVLHESGFDYRPDPAWNRLSGAFGDLIVPEPGGTPPTWLADAEDVLADTLPSYERAVGRGGATIGASYGESDPNASSNQDGADHYGMWIYGAMHNSWDPARDRTEFYRLFQNSHYQNVALAWLLYYRNGDADALRWARATGDLFANVGFLAAGPFAGTIRHVEGPFPWSAATSFGHSGHFADATTLAYRWLLTGDVRSRRLLDLWASGFVDHTHSSMPDGGIRPDVPSLTREYLPALSDWVQYYIARGEGRADPRAALALWYITRLAQGDNESGSHSMGLVMAPMIATSPSTCPPSTGGGQWGWFEEQCYLTYPSSFESCFSACSSFSADHRAAVISAIASQQYRFHRDWLRSYYALTHDGSALTSATRFLRDVAPHDDWLSSFGVPLEIVSFLELADAEHEIGATSPSYTDRDTALLTTWRNRGAVRAYDDAHQMFTSTASNDRWAGFGPSFIPSHNELQGLARMLAALRSTPPTAGLSDLAMQELAVDMPEITSSADDGGPTMWYPVRPAPAGHLIVTIPAGTSSPSFHFRRDGVLNNSLNESLTSGAVTVTSGSVSNCIGEGSDTTCTHRLPWTQAFGSSVATTSIAGNGAWYGYAQADLVPDVAEMITLYPPPFTTAWSPTSGRPLDYGSSSGTGSGWENYPYFTYHASGRQRWVLRVPTNATTIAAYSPFGPHTNHAVPDHVDTLARLAASDDAAYVELRTIEGILIEAHSCGSTTPVGTRHWLFYDAASADDREVCYDLEPGDYWWYSAGWYAAELATTHQIYLGESVAELDAVLGE